MDSLNVVFLGFTVPRAEIDRILEVDREMPIQTHTFAWNVVETLLSGGCNVELVSAAPVSNFPSGNPALLVRGYRFSERSVSGNTVDFLNVLVLKHLTRLVSGFFKTMRALRRSDADVLIVHGAHSPFLAIGAVVSRMNRAKVVVILTDPPGVVLPTDGRVTAALKRLDRSIVGWLVRRLDGVIALAEKLHQMLAPQVPLLLIDGIVSERDLWLDGPSNSTGRDMVYAGGLSEEYGVRALVEGVLLADSGPTLHIYGRGPLQDWVGEKAKKSNRIVGPTLVGRGELLRRYRLAACLVQPRPADSELAASSFPSKMMEYFASGVPVLSTRLSAIVDDFEDSAYWVRGGQPEDFAEAIDLFFDSPPEERLRLAANARKILVGSRGSGPRGEQFREFLSGLVNGLES